MKKILILAAIACAFAGCETPQRQLATKDFTFMNWDVGHFSEGTQPTTWISDEKGEERAKVFRDFIDRADVDMIGVCEFSENFTSNGTFKAAKTLWGTYGAKIGPTEEYQCNAVFYRNGLRVLESKVEYFPDHEQDTYYIANRVDIGGIDVWVVQTMLDWRTYVIGHTHDRQKQMQKLIDDFKDCPRVVISGNFNVGVRSPGSCFPAPEEYDVFIANGFMLANINGTGTYPSELPEHPFDNIVTRGVNISEVRFISAKGISNHDAISCKITAVIK